MKIRSLFIATLLASCLWLQACAIPSWVNNAEAIAEVAVPIAGSIVDIIDPALAPAVTITESAFSALVKTLDTYKAAPTATNLQAVQAAFDAVNANSSQLVAAAQVKNGTLGAQIIGVIGLIDQAVTQIAALVPQPVAAKLALPRAGTLGNGWKAKDFKKAFNVITKGDPRFKPLK